MNFLAREIAALSLMWGLWLGSPAACPAAWDPAPGSALSSENRERVQQVYSTQVNRCKADKNMLVLPGLTADQARQRVDILAESTGLSSNSIVEFLLISQASRHGYEAIAVSFARPSDIHKALVFIGMQPGAPYNPQQTRLWPKGERVVMSFVSGATSNTVRAEKLVLDTRTGRSLPETGFIFTGSLMVPSGDGSAGNQYGADVCEPQAIASVYNDPYSVLDVGRMARQSDVYGTQVANPELLLPVGELLTILLEPEYKDGRKRVKDLILEVRPAADSASQTNNTFRTNAIAPPRDEAAVFRLLDPQGRAVAKEQGLPALRENLASMVARGCDLFVSVRFGKEMRLGSVQKICRLISDLDNGAAMRVEPPAPGELYYRAFLADQQWRKRENRVSQPWELSVTEKGGVLSGRLIQAEAVGEDDDLIPKFKTTEIAISDPPALRRELEADAEGRKSKQQRPRLPVVLVFSDPALSYGRLVDFINPAMSSGYVVYVFLQSP